MSKKLAFAVTIIIAMAAVVYIALNSNIKPYILPEDARLPDGSRYYGELKDNLLSGEGALIWLDGTRYAGGFSKGMFSGYGKLYLDYGDVYSGQFKQGEYHGQGEYITDYGEIYTGNFIDSEFTGEGEYTEPDGSHYKGGFKNWFYHGEGILTSGGGDVFKGMFVDGSFEGKGEFQGEDGSIYTGNFEYGEFEGEGDLITAEGDHYQGEFQYGLYHGNGKLTYAEPKNGQTVQEGKWLHGRYADDKDTQKLNVEKVLYNQNQLLKQSLDNILPTDKDKINLYFVGLGGYGKQDVFYKEVTTIQQMFDASLDTAGRSTLLINNPETVDTYPLATATGLDRILQGVSNKMDVENDILFLYLSSHGSKDFKISLKQKGLDLPSLPAKQLAKIVDDLSIKWKVIVISACYSGGFIDELANDHTMIITAAAKDRTSFGCSDDADMTYFGRAFFQDALLETHSFVNTFDLATELVKNREEEAFPDSKYSDPQISKPQAIVEQLKLWRTGLPTSYKVNSL